MWHSQQRTGNLCELGEQISISITIQLYFSLNKSPVKGRNVCLVASCWKWNKSKQMTDSKRLRLTEIESERQSAGIKMLIRNNNQVNETLPLSKIIFSATQVIWQQLRLLLKPHTADWKWNFSTSALQRY